VCDLETIGASSIFRLIREVASFDENVPDFGFEL
jgi:hypothetical protein